MMARLPPSLAPAKLQCVYARKSQGDGMAMAMEADAGFGVAPAHGTTTCLIFPM
jgi:hypothetical protein